MFHKLVKHRDVEEVKQILAPSLYDACLPARRDQLLSTRQLGAQDSPETVSGLLPVGELVAVACVVDEPMTEVKEKSLIDEGVRAHVEACSHDRRVRRVVTGLRCLPLQRVSFAVTPIDTGTGSLR
ncbi:hypothetical protein N801_09805 [Knoellia aerolata DSM 18566]|uniref:Uncharacterized protein n=1 Tax=Knoellia aerolata DSM 18566 TaxID=1385519 RepID=A0A0A0JWL3_9MICO|nr:hypothetical protein N801_09805 [Knoellia aerolata DSM 18566]